MGHPERAFGVGFRMGGMGAWGSLRFWVLLDLAKTVIYAVDGLRVWWYRVHGRGGAPVPEVGRAVRIPRDGRALAGWMMQPEGEAKGAVLILHGIGDRMVYWRRAQMWLAEAGIASVVFHYSGYARSGGRTTPEQLQLDARVAYAWLCRELGLPVVVLGFSLGSGLAVEVVGDLVPQPAGLVVCEGYTTLREAAGRMGRGIGFLKVLLPDVWRSVEGIGRVEVPVLVVHCEGDQLFPVKMARELAEACGGDLVVVPGGSHNVCYLEVPEAYWAVVRDFVKRVVG